MNQAETPFYIDCLKQELAKRCEKNSNYSLRAFARALGLDPGNLSRVLAGKSFLSAENIEQILERVALAPQEKSLFLNSILEEQRNRKLKGFRKQVRGNEQKPNTSATLDIEMFRIISDWYHCAILELTFVKDFKSDVRWIAKKLGITPTEAKLAIERLQKLELLDEKNGKLKKSTDRVNTGDRHLTTPALRKLQSQILDKAKYALENDPIEERSQTGMTMAINPKKLPLAKKMIQEFTDSLCQVLETGEQVRVYQLSVSLFPLQSKEDPT